MVERQHQPTSATGAGVPREPAPAAGLRGAQRRVLDTPANDNMMSTGQRLARVAIFVAIGSVLTWLLRELFS